MFFKKNENGQVLVEAAIVMPLMVFFTLGIMQMTMMQQAKIMTDYAAYAAARSGVVNNADPDSMAAAANIAVLPTRARTNSLRTLATAYLMYVIGDKIGDALDNLLGGIGGHGLFTNIAAAVQGTIQGFLKNSLGINTFGFATVAVTNPLFSDFTDIGYLTKDSAPGSGVNPADDFDNLQESVANATTARGVTNRDKNVLTVAVSYNYELKIPFANWIIFEIWSASQVGVELTGAIWSSRIKLGFKDSNATGGGGLISRGMTRGYLSAQMITGANDGSPKRVFQKIRVPLALLWGLQQQSIYVIPIYGTYSMRMHSNVYKTNLSEDLEQTLMSN